MEVAVSVVHSMAIRIRPSGTFRIIGIIPPDTQHSLDATDDATNSSADNGAHRAGCVHTDSASMRHAIWNALCLCRHG
jgi:hypothetical protein